MTQPNDNNTGSTPSAGRNPQRELPKWIGEYKIDDLIGRGSMGKVYRATALDGKVVALKVITESITIIDADIQRFLRESAAAAHLGQHPHVATVYDTGSIESSHYIAMEFIPGGKTLQDVLDKRQLGIEETLDWVIPMAEALEFAHSHGVMHRDLKPANILISENNAPLLCDFGLAKGNDAANLTVTGEIFGTPKYMSPEQARLGPKAITMQSDIYSFGIIFYEMLCGDCPYDFSNARGFTQIIKAVSQSEIRRPRSLNPEIDARLEAVLLKFLTREPADRFASMTDAVAALRHYVEGDPGLTARIAAWARRLLSGKPRRAPLG